MVTKFHVSAGRMEVLRHVHDDETGEVSYRADYVHGVELTTDWGHSYTHLHSFPDDASGSARAERLARRIEAFVTAHGVDALKLDHWAVRTVYGSQAYLDEEPDLVERERSDALLNECA